MITFPRSLQPENSAAATEAVATSHEAKAPVVAALGGMSSRLVWVRFSSISMERGVIQALAMNGATAIHDLELAMIGETSEDVATHIADGTFGMSAETADSFRKAAQSGAEGVGLGAALGDLINDSGMPHPEISILSSARRLGIPATVHVAMGTDIVHMHSGVAGAEMGEATGIDFRLLAAVVHDLENGCWLNIGSAVVMPRSSSR